MRIALAQMNSHLGDFTGNSDKIIDFCHEALEKRCDLIVFPELALFGYHPCDLLERPSVVEKQIEVLNHVVTRIPKDITCLVGAVTLNSQRGKPYFNSALLIQGGEIKKTFSKELLPVYDVFDDSRHFAAGRIVDNSFELGGKKIQVLICEDMWGWDERHAHNPIVDLKKDSCDLIINLSASPYTMEKRYQRIEYVKKTAQTLGAPLVYVNMVGAQDELIFDGGSFVMDKNGKTLAHNCYFSEDLNLVDLSDQKGGFREKPQADMEHLHQALVLGIRDFVYKIGFKKVHLGLSGGIDSALVACLAADAVGPQNLTCLALPSQFNSSLSYELAKKLCENIGCEFKELSIQPGFETMVNSYEKSFGKKEFSILHENLQARLRGVFLMAYSNENGSLLLTTGNKSEYATGYATLYGDMCGGLAPIADLLKNQVYDLCYFYNREHEIIPKQIMTRPPSAELKENQKDSDSLPDYSVLDNSVERLVCKKEKPKTDVDTWVLKRLYTSEFKRWQAAPVLKISDHAFGQGRRMPIAHKANI